MYKLVIRSVSLKRETFLSLILLMLISTVMASAAKDPVAAWLFNKKGNMVKDISGNVVNADWGPYLHYCTGTEDEFIGGGQQNTSVFEQDHPGSNYAANICYHSSSGGYTDWFLPSKSELWQVMLNISLIDSAIKIYGGDTILPGFHWSSSQVDSSNDIRYAHGSIPYTFQMPSGIPNGPIHNIKSKNTEQNFRAVRCMNNDCSFLLNTVVDEQKGNKKIINITDVLGRTTQKKKNLTLFYIYDDGYVEKKIIIE